MQCKVPLFVTEPNINLCIKEAGHDDIENSFDVRLHHTYGKDDIWFTARGRDCG